MLATYAALLGVALADPMSYLFQTRLDHFSSTNQDPYTTDEKFDLRYILDESYFRNADPTANLSQPILFYAGNEGDIWDFYDNTGFINELANMTGGMVVYAEHRYFG
jgi:lysosomal Pro-X carboxypeptidase